MTQECSINALTMTSAQKKKARQLEAEEKKTA